MGNLAKSHSPVLRALELLELILSDGGRSSLSAIARSAGWPVSSAHRHAATLVQGGYLAPSGYARHVAGARLRPLLGALDERQIAASLAAPVLHRLAGELRCVVQLGTYENDMVTYRIKTGRGAGDLFTKVGLQLEAYCSGMGKVLLAHLPASEREAYLAGGPFVALTVNTITDPARLRGELDRVRATGFAEDREEVAEGLCCLAIPLHNRDGRVIAAISASQSTHSRKLVEPDRLLFRLRAAAAEIEAAL